MGIIAAAVKELIALGVEGEALIGAIERLEEANNPTRLALLAAAEPTARQLRNQRHYEKRRLKASEKRLKCLNSDAPLSPSEELNQSSNTENNQPLSPKENPPTGVKRKGPSKRCPDDWTPSGSVLETALKQGLTSEERDTSLAAFRDYEFHTAHRDWDATARNWLRKTGDQKRRFAGRGGPAPPIRTTVGDTERYRDEVRRRWERTQQREQHASISTHSS